MKASGAETGIAAVVNAAAEARHEAVIALCDQLLTRPTEHSGDQRSELEFLRADALRHLGYWTQAAEAFRRCAANCRPRDAARASRALRLLSDIERRSRRYEQATEAAAAAMAMAEQRGDPAGYLLAEVSLVRVYSDRGRMDQVEVMLQRVIAAAARLAAEPAERALTRVTAHTVLSLYYFRQHRLTHAVRTLTDVAEEAAGLQHAVTRAAYHRQLAILHEVQRGYSAAVRHLNEALRWYDAVRFESGRYDVYWSLSRSYTDLGDLRTARLCLENCREIAERLDWPVELGKTFASFAALAMRDGDYGRAIDLFERDLAASRQLDDRQALGHCHRHLAECYHLMGDQAQAEEHARASIADFEATSRASEAGRGRVYLSQILVAAQRLTEAGHELGDVRRLPVAWRELDLAAIRRAEAQLAQAAGEPAVAAAAFAESIALHGDHQPSRELAAMHHEAAAACRCLGDLAATRHHLARAVETAGTIGSRDLWETALEELRQIDLMEAQRLMLKPYLPGGAADELRGGEAAGRLARATIVFVDMRDATALSGRLTPVEVAEVVSDFLGPVVRIILNWGGTVDKFIGDCVMAVFGLQGADDGAEAAVRAGHEVTEYMEATREVRRRSGASILAATIGVNTGEVVAGCFGPLLRRDYTVLGYHVNLAQRLQVLAGAVDCQQSTRMVISEGTRLALAGGWQLQRIDVTDGDLKGIAPADVGAWLVTGEPPA